MVNQQYLNYLVAKYEEKKWLLICVDVGIFLYDYLCIMTFLGF